MELYRCNKPQHRGPRKTTFWKGDKAVYLGTSEEKHGVTWYHLVLVEGHRKGERVVTSTPPPGGST